MDASSPLGAAVKDDRIEDAEGKGGRRGHAGRHWSLATSVATTMLFGMMAPVNDVAAADRYAVVITGASAAPTYAEKYDRWRNALVSTLKQRFAYPDDHVYALGENVPSP
jgi:hypothetical protein